MDTPQNVKSLNILTKMFSMVIYRIINYKTDDGWSEDIHRIVCEAPDRKYVDMGNKYHSKYILPQFKKVICEQVK